MSPRTFTFHRPGVLFLLTFLLVSFTAILIRTSSQPPQAEVYILGFGVQDSVHLDPSREGVHLHEDSPQDHLLSDATGFRRREAQPKRQVSSVIKGRKVKDRFDKPLYRQKRGKPRATLAVHTADKDHEKGTVNSTVRQRHQGETKKDNNLRPTEVQSTPCEEKLVVFVISALTNIHLRAAIRETWGSAEVQKSHGFCLRFVIGCPTAAPGEVGGPNMTQHLRREFLAQSDLITTNTGESYANLTLKSLATLEWCRKYCRNVDIVLKTDDDVFANIPNIIQFTTTFYPKGNIHSRHSLLGHVIKSGQPIQQRYSKYYMPTSMYSKSSYPSYLSGSAYILPAESIRVIIQQARGKKPFWLEDVYVTGILVKMGGLRLQHSDSFIVSKKGFASTRKAVCQKTS